MSEDVEENLNKKNNQTSTESGEESTIDNILEYLKNLFGFGDTPEEQKIKELEKENDKLQKEKSENFEKQKQTINSANLILEDADKRIKKFKNEGISKIQEMIKKNNIDQSELNKRIKDEIVNNVDGLKKLGYTNGQIKEVKKLFEQEITLPANAYQSNNKQINNEVALRNLNNVSRLQNSGPSI